MENNTQFDALSYFKELAEKNVLGKKCNFHSCFCSGPDGIEGVLQNFKSYANFIMIDDTTVQNTHSHGVTFFDRNAYTVFILAGYKWDDMEDRQQKLKLCHKIFRQFHSRLIYDKATMKYGDALAYLDVDTIYSKELPRYSMNGYTGLYFMINNDEPVDLTYNENEWEE